MSAFSQRYQILNRVGESRVATVHRASDLRLQRPVLLHVMHTDRSVEAQHWQHLHQINRTFLSVYDTGMLDGRPFVVTEDVVGQPLRDVAPLSPEEALRVVQTVAAAVTAAQAQHAQHPAVTSSNVWLMEHGRVVLLEDWQTAQAERSQIDAAYQAPSPDGAVYALGILLREALVGTPHPSNQQIAHGSPQLIQIIERATSRVPQQRYATVEQFAHALDQYAAALRAQTTHLPPLHQSTTPMPPAMAWQGTVPGNIPPPRTTKVMPSPPPPLAVPAHVPNSAEPVIQQQVSGGWGPPKWRPSWRQPALVRRGLSLGFRLALAILLIIVVGSGITAFGERARAFDPANWVRAQVPQIDLGAWIDQHTPQFDIGRWIEQQTPDLSEINIGEWIQRQVGSIGESVSSEFNNLRSPAIYRVTQSINLRSEPSAIDGSTIIDQLPVGTRVQQRGTPRSDTNGQPYQWVRVIVLDDPNQQEGWIALLDNHLEPEE